MNCHYKTNPSACIPPVNQTLPVEQDMTQSGKGSYKNIYFMVADDLQFVQRLSALWPSYLTQGNRHASTSLHELKFYFSFSCKYEHVQTNKFTHIQSCIQRKQGWHLISSDGPFTCLFKYSLIIKNNNGRFCNNNNFFIIILLNWIQAGIVADDEDHDHHPYARFTIFFGCDLMWFS